MGDLFQRKKSIKEFAIQKSIESVLDENHTKELEDRGEEIFEAADNIRNDEIDNWTPPQPSSDTRIWRYLNFTQLQSILEREQLWFSNIMNFDDPYEGTIPKGNVEREIEELKENLEVTHKIAKKLHNVLLERALVEDGYVNCWNINQYESAALWEQYVDSKEGIAISTTVDRLEAAIVESEINFRYGAIEYINYEEDNIPDGKLPPLFHKRKSFEHENEFRVSFIDTDDVYSPSGGYISVDTNMLIEEIYIAPTSESWFYDLVEKVLRTYDVGCDLHKSDLYSDPVY